jgi:hypothetical protein
MTGAVSIAPDAVVALRDRLRCLRADLRRRLAESETIEPAWLAILADTETVLAAITGALAAIATEACQPPESEPAARAVVSDDGTEIRLTLYAENGAAFAAPIAPGRAVALAGELIAAALPKLAR